MLLVLLLASLSADNPDTQVTNTLYLFPEKDVARGQSISPRLTSIGIIALAILGTAIVGIIVFVLKPAFEEDIAPLITESTQE